MTHLLVNDFVKLLENAEQNPYRAVFYALVFLHTHVNPADYIDKRKLAKCEAAFLRATNRVILDPYDYGDAPPGGRKTFHIKWLQSRVLPLNEKQTDLAILSEGGMEYESTHFRLRVDGCRYRFHKCSDCHSPDGVGAELSRHEVDILRSMLEKTYAKRAIYDAASCVRDTLTSHAHVPLHLQFPSYIGDYSYNVINHEIAAEAFETCLLPFMSRLKDNPVRHRLTPANGVDRFVTAVSVSVQRRFSKNPSADDAKLPYHVRHALSRTDEWSFVIHWVEKDLLPTRAREFDVPVEVYNADGEPQGTVIVQRLLYAFERPQWMRRPATMEQIEAKMEADEDVLEEKARKQRLDAKAKLYHLREMKAAMHRGETYDPMQWEPDEDEGDDE